MSTVIYPFDHYKLDVLPIDGRLMLREPLPERDNAGDMPPA
jgi:hypothetical protein